jgi:hypothetical protein
LVEEEESIVLPSVQQVGQVSNPAEPGGGCSPRFIIDRVVTGMPKCSKNNSEEVVSKKYSRSSDLIVVIR